MKTSVSILRERLNRRMSIEAARFAQAARTIFPDKHKKQCSVSQTQQNRSQLQIWDNEGGRFE